LPRLGGTLTTSNKLGYAEFAALTYGQSIALTRVNTVVHSRITVEMVRLKIGDIVKQFHHLRRDSNYPSV